jgi:long-chain fatty acid transport protein
MHVKGVRVRRSTPQTLIAFLATLAALAPSPAEAGGMFLPARGTRPLGRAGAYVAGGDDLESIWYNPAGLAGTGHLSLMLEGGLVFQSIEIDRIDSGGNRRDPVYDNNGLLPIPFLGVSWRPEALGKRFTFAFAAYAPYSGVPRYPEDGAQRFSLVSLGGTAAAFLELAVSIRITPRLYIGAGFQSLYFALSNKTVLSSCTQLNCAPEDPRFDSPTQTKVTSPFTPTGNFGFLYVGNWLRAGASLQLPIWVHATGTVATRLPSDPMFDGAVVVGNGIEVDLTLPLIARVGVEGRPTKRARIELEVDYEAWSMQKDISFTPQNVYIDHVIGVGRYDLKPMVLDRSMKDVFSVHLGGEYDVLPHRLTVRGGYLFESNSMPDETVNAITPDGDKHMIAIGGALHLGGLRLDAAYAHVFQGDRNVTNSRSLQLNPISPSIAVPVGNGRYAVSTDVLSLGLEGRF